MVAQWETFTNIKAGHQHAGQRSGPYEGKGKDFSPYELKKNLGIYILQGISPYPQVHMKFKTKEADEINGCDFISRCLKAVVYARCLR